MTHADSAHDPQDATTLRERVRELERSLAGRRDDDQLYRTIVESSAEVIFMVDRDLVFRYANQALADLVERPLSEIIGHPTASLFPRRIAERHAIVLRKVLETGEPYRWDENAVVVPSGVRWRDTLLVPLKDSAGEVTSIVGMVRDVTDRRLAQEALAENRRFLQMVLDTTSEVIFVFDLDKGGVTYINREAPAGTGTDGGDPSVAAWAAAESNLHPDDLPALHGIIQRATAATDGERLEVECRVMHPDGEWHWTVVRLVVFERRPDRSVRSLLGVSSDITQRQHRLQELERSKGLLEEMVEERTRELRRVNAELEAALAAKSAFLANMSHELRTPLNSIIGFSGTLANGLAGELDSEQYRQARMINTSGRHLLQLIDQVLDLSVIEYGRIRVEPDIVDVTEVAGRVVELLAPIAEEHRVEMRCDVASGVPQVVSDEFRLRQVLLNVVGNAVKFTRDGTVDVRISPDGAGVAVSVSDTGLGIAPADLESVFEEFYQADREDVAKSSGTGLGLPISRRLLTALGGTIEVASVLGSGSTFTIRLPRTPPME